MFDSNSESFDGISIFRPSIKAEILARNYVETTLRAKYPPGEYTQDDKLGEIIQYMASISDNSVRDIIQQIASRSLLFFLLDQYDLSALIQKRSMNLNEKEAKRWQKLGPVFRRATKYLIELTTLFQQAREPMVFDYFLIEQAFIYAEILMELCNVCDATYYLFPEQSKLIISEPGSEIYYTIDTGNNHIDDLLRRINFDKNKQKEIFTPKEIPIYDFKTQCKYLDNAFNETIGTTYNTSMSIIFSIIENSRPAENDCSSLFVQRQQIISIASSRFNISSKSLKEFYLVFLFLSTSCQIAFRLSRNRNIGLLDVPSLNGIVNPVFIMFGQNKWR